MNLIGHTVSSDLIIGGIQYSHLTSLPFLLNSTDYNQNIYDLNGIKKSEINVSWGCSSTINEEWILLLFGKNQNGYLPSPASLYNVYTGKKYLLIPGTESDSPYPRILPGCTKWNGTTIHVLGGITPDGIDGDLWTLSLINPSNITDSNSWIWKWQAIPTIPHLISPTLIKHEKGILSCFGGSLPNWNTSSNCTLIGNLTGLPMIENIPNYITPRLGTTLVSKNENLYIVGGWKDNDTILSDSFQLDNVSFKSTSLGYTIPSNAMSYIYFNDDLNIIGGTNSSNLMTTLSNTPPSNSSLILSIVSLSILVVAFIIMLILTIKSWKKGDERIFPFWTRFIEKEPLEPSLPTSPLQILPKQLGSGEVLTFTPWKCNNEQLINETLMRINQDAITKASESYERIKFDYREMQQIPFNLSNGGMNGLPENGNFGYDTGFNKSIDLSNGGSISFGAGFGYGLGWGHSQSPQNSYPFGAGGGGGGGGGLEYRDGNGWRLGFGAGMGGGGGFGWDEKGLGLGAGFGFGGGGGGGPMDQDSQKDNIPFDESAKDEWKKFKDSTKGFGGGGGFGTGFGGGISLLPNNDIGMGYGGGYGGGLGYGYKDDEGDHNWEKNGGWNGGWNGKLKAPKEGTMPIYGPPESDDGSEEVGEAGSEDVEVGLSRMASTIQDGEIPRVVSPKPKYPIGVLGNQLFDL